MNILLIGDAGQDVYHHGSAKRLSPEAPVPIFTVESTSHRPGMASNVKENLVAQGAKVTFVHREISSKVRFIDSRFNHHLLRVDHDQRSGQLLREDLPKDLLEFDAIVISDYQKGTVSYELLEQLIDLKERPIIFIDTKKPDLKRLDGDRVVIKINEEEHGLATSTVMTASLVITRGSNGVIVHHGGRTVVEPVPPIEVFDVTGAGDTFLVTLTSTWLMSRSPIEAVRRAITASGLTVKRLGTYAPTSTEIDAALKEINSRVNP